MSALACALLAGCSGGRDEPRGGPEATPPRPVVETASDLGALEGALTLLAPAGYLDGDRAGVSEVLRAFGDDTGCEVSAVNGAPEGGLAEAMAEHGAVDVVIAPGSDSNALIEQGLVQPIDPALVPADATVDRRLLDRPNASLDGRRYGEPLQWGATVLVYDERTLPAAPTSWDVMFEAMELPDGGTTAGRVQSYDGTFSIATAALLLRSRNSDLGIDDPFQLTRPQFDAAVELVSRRRALLDPRWAPPQADGPLDFWDRSSRVLASPELVDSGSLAVASWELQTGVLPPTGPIRWTVPSDGTTAWSDVSMIAADAPHPSCSYRWLDWSIGPDAQAAFSKAFRSLPVVPVECPDEEATGCVPSALLAVDLSVWSTATTCDDECVPYEEWIEGFGRSG